MSESALFVGDVCNDHFFVIDRLPGPDEKIKATASFDSLGGVVCNAAVACSRAGVKAGLMARVGNDAAGRGILDQLRAEGVVPHICFDETETAQVVILLEPHGEKRVILGNGGSYYPDVAQVADFDFGGISWVHTAAYGHAAASLVQHCRAHSIRWSFDLEPATFANGIDDLSEIIRGAEAIFCNQHAARLLGENAPELLLRMGARSVILTLGSKGARLWDSGGAQSVIAPPAVAIKDTTGAGDCLAGWFIAERLSGLSPLKALSNAVAAAAHSCGSFGAQRSFPTREQAGVRS